MAAFSFVRKLLIRRGGEVILGITDFSSEDSNITVLEGAVSCATSVWLDEGDVITAEMYSTNNGSVEDVAEQVVSRFNLSLLAGAPIDEVVE